MPTQKEGERKGQGGKEERVGIGRGGRVGGEKEEEKEVEEEKGGRKEEEERGGNGGRGEEKVMW